MTLTQIRYFLEVSQSMNLSVAAKHLYISQSSLSKYIAQMEKELGFLLLNRGNRGVSLTPAGEQFLQHIQEPYYSLINSIQVGASLGHQQPTIHMAMPYEQQIQEKLLELIRSWNLGARDSNISIEYETSQKMITRLIAGDFDLLISDEPDAEQNQNLRCDPLFQLQSVLAFHDRHPNVGKKNLTLADFSDDLFLVSLRESSEQLQRSAQQIEENFGFKPRFYFTASASSSLLNVISGLGVTIIPNLYLRPDMTRLKILPLENIRPHWCNLVLRGNESDSEILALRDEILEAFR